MSYFTWKQRNARHDATRESTSLLVHPRSADNQSEPVIPESSPELFLFKPPIPHSTSEEEKTTEADKQYELIAAIKNGDTELLESLLKDGIDPNLPVEDYENANEMRLRTTPLCIAADQGQAECIKILLRMGADPDIFSNGRSHQNSDETDHTGSRNSTIAFAPLHIAAMQNSELGIKALVEGEATVDIQDLHGRTSLLYAASPGNVAATKILLELGASPDFRDRSGTTALQIVGRNLGVMKKTKESAEFTSKYAETALLLLKSGATYSDTDNDTGRTLLHQAAISGSPEIVAEIIRIHQTEGSEDGFIEILDKNGKTALHLAAYYSNYDCIELLVKAGANLLHRDDSGTTAIDMMLSLPDGTRCFQKILDEHLTPNGVEPSERNFGVTIDFAPLLNGASKNQTQILGAIIDFPMNETRLLEHPLIDCFLALKWQKAKYIFYAQLILYLCLVLGITLFVLHAISPANMGDQISGNALFIALKWVILGLTYILVLIQEIILICASYRHYFKEEEGYVKIAVLCCSATLIIFDVKSDWLVYIAATSVFLGWTEVTLFFGRLPTLGPYTAMFNRIVLKPIQFTVVFSFFLIGFVVTFYVLLKNELDHLLVGGAGRASNATSLNLGQNPAFPGTSQVIYSLYLVFMLVGIMGLLIGLAVSDISGSLKVGRIELLRGQARYIIQLEHVYHSKYLKILQNHSKLAVERKMVIHPFLEKTTLPEPICKAIVDIFRLRQVKKDDAKVRGKDYDELKEELKRLRSDVLEELRKNGPPRKPRS